MKILYLVHMEKMFEDFIDGDLIFDTIRVIVTGNYDKVVAVCSYVEGFDSVFDWLKPGITEEEEWGWGYEGNCY